MGCISILEALTLVWAWNSDTLANNEMACRIVTRYVTGYEMPQAAEYDHPTLHGVRLLTFAELLSKAQEYVVAHEFAHVLLGHLADAAHSVFPTGYGELTLATKSREQEFAADELALRLILPSSDTDSLALRQVCVAPYIVFGVAALIEATFDALRPSERPNNDSHPPAVLRLTAARSALAAMGLLAVSDLGEKFLVFIQDCMILMMMKLKEA